MVKDGALSKKNTMLQVFRTFKILKGTLIALLVRAILLNRWVLPVGGVALGREGFCICATIRIC